MMFCLGRVVHCVSGPEFRSEVCTRFACTPLINKIANLIFVKKKVVHGLMLNVLDLEVRSPNATGFRTGLHVVSVGENDYRLGYHAGMTFDQVVKWVPDVVGNITAVLEVRFFFLFIWFSPSIYQCDYIDTVNMFVLTMEKTKRQ